MEIKKEKKRSWDLCCDPKSTKSSESFNGNQEFLLFQEEQLGESGKARLQTFSESLKNMTAYLNPSNNDINVVQNLN